MSQERQPYANVRRVGSRCNSIDTHEILKQEIYKQGSSVDNFSFSVLNSTTPTPPQVQNTGSNFADYELYFDSVNRDTSSDLTNGELKWSITNLNNTQDVKNCVEVSLGSFFFPKIYSSSTILPEYFYYRRVFMWIANAPSTQAVLAANNNKFHFEFEVNNINGQAVELVPIKNAFFFQQPITSLTDFDAIFYVPNHALPNSFKKIPIPQERVAIQSQTTGGFGYNPIRFKITDGNLTTSILGPIGAVTAPGIAGFITGYASNDATTNTAVNNTDGLYITNIIDSTTFEVGAINGNPVNSTVNAILYVPKNRVAFPVRFTSVTSQPTNYITVNHE